jgi:hypothetical protein
MSLIIKKNTTFKIPRTGSIIQAFPASISLEGALNSASLTLNPITSLSQIQTLDNEIQSLAE